MPTRTDHQFLQSKSRRGRKEPPFLPSTCRTPKSYQLSTPWASNDILFQCDPATSLGAPHNLFQYTNCRKLSFGGARAADEWETAPVPTLVRVKATSREIIEFTRILSDSVLRRATLGG